MVEEKYTNRRTRTFSAIVGLMVQIAYVYDVFSQAGNNGGVSQNLDKIEKSLAKIQLALSDITYALQDIENEIKLLPEKISGNFKADYARFIFGRAGSATQRIRQAVLSAPSQYVLAQLNKDIDLIHDDIGEISGGLGVGGAFIASPLFSVWLSASAYRESLRRKLDANYEIESPWFGIIVGEMKNAVQILYANMKAEREYYSEIAIPHFPEYNRRYVPKLIGRNYYFRHSPPPSLQGNPDSHFRVTLVGGREVLQWREFLLPPGVPENWSDVNPINPTPPDSGSAALSAFRLFQRDRSELEIFSTIEPLLLEQQQSLLAAFSEPPGIWVGA